MLAQEIKQAMAEIGPSCQDLLEAIYLEGKLYKELTQEFGANEGTLRKRAFDCLRKLRDIWKRSKEQ